MMEIDRERNCYNCERFGYFAWNLRTVGQEKRIEYRDNSNSVKQFKREGESSSLVTIDTLRIQHGVGLRV